MTRSLSAASSTRQCARETAEPATMMSAGAVRPIFRPAGLTTKRVSGSLAVEPCEAMDLVAFAVRGIHRTACKIGSASSSSGVGLRSSEPRALLSASSAASISSSALAACGLSSAAFAVRPARGRAGAAEAGFGSAARLCSCGWLAPLHRPCVRPTRRRKSLTNVCQRLSDVSPVQSARSAAWVSSKMIGRSQGFDNDRNQLVAAIGQGRLGPHPARSDRARRPEHDHGLGRPQFLFDNLVECLARTQRGVPPHAESLSAKDSAKCRAAGPVFSAVRDKDVSVRTRKSPCSNHFPGDHYRATEMLRWLTLMTTHFA